VHAFATQRWNAFEPTDFAVCVSAAKASLPAGSQWLADAASCSGRPPERLRLTCRVRPEQPLLVKAGYTSEMRAAVGSRWPAPGGLSGVPLLKERDGKLTQFAVDAAFPLDPQGRPFVPGSSVRGVIRTRAERVSRTVADASRKAWDLDDLQQHAKDLRGRRNWLEAVEVPCLVTQVFGFERLGGRIGFTDAVPVDPMAFEDRRKLLDHVAIDRFTGGAADQRKFNERPYVPRKDDAGSADDKGDLTCEIELFDFEERHLGLLLLLLRDLALGRVQFGANRNDGMGRLVLVSVEATALTARGGLLWTEGATEREVAGLSEVDTSMDCPRPDGYLTDTKRLWADVFRRAEQACRTYLATPTAATPAQGEADDAG
jgi:CRISPR/Cas system CSM-associated protein Csm3 (group 7 of RAMP superfamily)